jgi:hypothetical protein
LHPGNRFLQNSGSYGMSVDVFEQCNPHPHGWRVLVRKATYLDRSRG